MTECEFFSHFRHCQHILWLFTEQILILTGHWINLLALWLRLLVNYSVRDLSCKRKMWFICSSCWRERRGLDFWLQINLSTRLRSPFSRLHSLRLLCQTRIGVNIRILLFPSSFLISLSCRLLIRLSHVHCILELVRRGMRIHWCLRLVMASPAAAMMLDRIHKTFIEASCLLQVLRVLIEWCRGIALLWMEIIWLLPELVAVHLVSRVHHWVHRVVIVAWELLRGAICLLLCWFVHCIVTRRKEQINIVHRNVLLRGLSIVHWWRIHSWL